MNKELSDQRRQMLQVIRWINVIEECDGYIKSAYRVDYYKSVKQEAKEGYISSISAVMENAIEISKVEI